MVTSSSAGILAFIGCSLIGVAVAYQIAAVSVIERWHRRKLTTPAVRRPVSILKPLCGAEPGLYGNLRSFCVQDYPPYQIVFGVAAANDPALETVKALQQEFPALDMTVAISGPAAGSNLKVSNLLNMLAYAKHDRLVLADSDIVVGSDYLENVTAPLEDPAVGIVTCAYGGMPIDGMWSRLGALFINDGFFPSILVAHALGSQAYAFGATIVLRRATLEAIGGFEALSTSLADDYKLGELTRRRGWRTELSGYIVHTTVHDPGLRTLWHREIRWSRTIRNLNPVGHFFSIITHSLPMAAIGVVLADGSLPSLWLLAIALGLRLALHRSVGRVLPSIPRSSWRLIPLRDTLTFIEWWASFGRRTVRWRDQRLQLHADGSAERRFGDSP